MASVTNWMVALLLGLSGCAANLDAFVADAGDATFPALELGVLDAAAPYDLAPTGSGRRYDALLLSVSGSLLIDALGAPIDFRGAISCCEGGYGWPLYDEAWVELVRAHGVGFLHARLGPFLTGPAGESDWATIGGGYLEHGGRADLDTWNDAFWLRVTALLEYAGARGMRVEIDLADGWAIKHCRAGDLPGYSAWAVDGNLQGEDVCGEAGSGPILPGGRVEAWVRKLVGETGRYGNVIYEDGNEIGLVPGYVATYTSGLQAIVRDEEIQRGYLPHLLGTNAGAAAAPGVDYVELHQPTPADPASCAGKPCSVNEYNPEPALSPVELVARWCSARAAGTYFWYWRHGQSDAELMESLMGMGTGCP